MSTSLVLDNYDNVKWCGKTIYHKLIQMLKSKLSNYIIPLITQILNCITFVKFNVCASVFVCINSILVTHCHWIWIAYQLTYTAMYTKCCIILKIYIEGILPKGPYLPCIHKYKIFCLNDLHLCICINSLRPSATCMCQ